MKQGPAFSEFVDRIEKDLMDPKRIRFNGYTDGLRKYFDPTMHRGLLNTYLAGRRQCLMALRGSRKFILSEEFVDFAIAAANSDPQIKTRLSLMAKPSFDLMWIQWRNSADYEYGFLIKRSNVEGEVYVIRPAVHFRDTKMADFYPIDIVTYASGTGAYPLGGSMRQRFCYAGTFFAELSKVAEKAKDWETLAKLDEWADRVGQEAKNFFTVLSPLLGMMVTHFSDDVTQTTGVKGSKRFIKSRFLPAYEYKVIDLIRPMDLKDFSKKIVKLYAEIDRRWHKVLGAWHHRRTPNELCSFTSDICPLAIWTPNLDDDRKEVGSHQHVCLICSRKRWWQPAHERGNKAIGVIEKDYRIKTG